MNTTQLSQPAAPRAARILTAILAGCTLACAPAFAADAGKKAAPVYENYLDLAVGGSNVSGDHNSFQKLLQQRAGGWGGIEGFHYYSDVNRDTSLTLDGHALAGNHDYLLNFKLERTDVGFVNVGYKEFRTWYDGSGGFFPPNDASFHLYDENQFIDRSDLWVAVGYTPPDGINFNFRYDYTTRKGLKDSTSWGDTSLTGGAGTRAIVPAFLAIDEHRHVFNASLSKDGEKTTWDLAGRYESNKQDNRRNEHRAPGEKADRYVTQTEGASSDLFMIHGSVESRLGEKLSLSTAAAHYDLDANLDGSRIIGISYDPVFDPVYASRQNHDEGFHSLEGGATMRQSFVNLNLMYTPTETFTIVPAVKADKTSWDAHAGYVETAVASNLVMAQDDMESESNKDLTSLTGTLDARYTGIANCVFSFAGEWLNSDGTLTEDLLNELGVDTTYRTTDYGQDQQKYAFTANWYARPGLSFTGQYYWKGRQNSFNNTRASSNPDPTSGDRYPAYLTHQDFETNDVNVRASWSPALLVHLVARYDYQESTIRTQEIGLTFDDSAKIKTHIISATATWNPLDRWFVQLGGNQVFNTTVTPASSLTGNAAGEVLNSDNNYFSGTCSTGYALDDRTDLSADYNYYRADNYVDNSARSLPYGAGATTQIASLTLNRRVNPQLNYTLKYTYAHNDDVLAGGMNNFRGNTVYAKVQYRF